MAKGNNWHLPVRMWRRVGRLYPVIIMMTMINMMTMIMMKIMMTMIITMMIIILGDHHEDVVSS